MRHALLLHQLERLRHKIARRPSYQLTLQDRELIQDALKIATQLDAKSVEIAQRHGFEVSPQQGKRK